MSGSVSSCLSRGLCLKQTVQRSPPSGSFSSPFSLLQEFIGFIITLDEIDPAKLSLRFLVYCCDEFDLIQFTFFIFFNIGYAWVIETVIS